jgi:hypothetical protein
LVVAVLVYAPPSGKAGPQLAEASQAIKRALRASGTEVVDGAIELARKEHARGWVDERELAFFAEARALFDEGKRALERVDLERAEATFTRVANMYDTELRRPGVAGLESEVMLARGIALFEQKLTGQADWAFRRAVALEPSAQLTEATVRPDVVRAFRAATAPGPKAKLSVVASPADAVVRVDGRLLDGTSGIEVGVGAHLILASAPGRFPVAEWVDVPVAGTERQIKLPPDPIDESLASLRTKPESLAVLQLLAELGSQVMVVALAIDGGVLTMVGQRLPETGPVTVRVKRDLDAAATELVTRLKAAPRDPEALDKGATLLDAQPIAHPRPPPVAGTGAPKAPKLKFYERPWLWAGVLVVTSLAVGLAAGLAPHDTTYQATVDGAKFGGTK